MGTWRWLDVKDGQRRLQIKFMGGDQVAFTKLNWASSFTAGDEDMVNFCEDVWCDEQLKFHYPTI